MGAIGGILGTAVKSPDTSAQTAALAAEKKAAQEKSQQLAQSQSEEYRAKHRKGLASLIGTSESGLTGTTGKTG